MSTTPSTDSVQSSSGVPSSATGRGAFIVLEGLDRSGKTTQADRLAKHLSTLGYGKVERMNFPNRTTNIGGLINGYLQNTSKDQLSDEVIHLLFSANRWESKAEIERKLNEGTTLIVDRYSFSGVAFSAAKQKPNMNVDWCFHPEVGLPKPDRVFFLSVSQDVAEKRGGYGQERYEKKEFQRIVADEFQKIINKQLGGVEWTVIDANKEMDEVTKAITDVAESVVNGIKNKPIQYMTDQPTKSN